MNRRKDMIAKMIFILLLFPVIITIISCRHRQSPTPARQEIDNGSVAYINKISDQQIIDTGVKKAKELNLNPIPICQREDGNTFIPAGFIFNIGSGGMSLKNGDMLINVTKKKISAINIPLYRGEYAIIENNRAKKGEGLLVTE